MISDSTKLQKPLVGDKIRLADGRVLCVFGLHYVRTKSDHKKLVSVIIEFVGGDNDGFRDLIAWKDWLKMVQKSTILKRGKE
jgi:hypothetical protein